MTPPPNRKLPGSGGPDCTRFVRNGDIIPREVKIVPACYGGELGKEHDVRTGIGVSILAVLLLALLLAAVAGCGSGSGGEASGPGGAAAQSPTAQAGGPDAPSDLAATAESRRRIALRWQDNSSSELVFEIERSRYSTASFEQIATVGAEVTTYSDIGVDSGMAYYYRVRAYNDAGHSAYSNLAASSTDPTDPTEGGEPPDASEGGRPEILHTAEDVHELVLQYLEGRISSCVQTEGCSPDPIAVSHFRTDLRDALNVSVSWHDYPEWEGGYWKWTATAAVEVPVKFPYGSSEPYAWDYWKKSDGSYATRPLFLAWTVSDEAPVPFCWVEDDCYTYRQWLEGKGYFYPTVQMLQDWFKQGRNL